MTDCQKVQRYILGMIQRNIRPYSLGLRAKQGLSSATAYKTKLCVNMLMDMEQSEIDTMLNNEEMQPYMRAFISLMNDLKRKENNKNIDKSKKFAKVIKDIKNQIEPLIVEQQAKIEKQMWLQWNNINNEYKELGETNFAKKYGKRMSYPGREYYSLSSFRMGRLGSMLNKREDRMAVDIKGTMGAYKDMEHAKIHKLITNLNERYPDIDKIKLIDNSRSVNGIEFRMSAKINTTKLFIDTTTIYAGGYNIQRLHLRWLMHVIDAKTGKTLTSFK